MRLIELSANKKSFKTVRFNPAGISIIAAIQETKDKRKTYNSVGKSLCVALVHYCLASSPIDDFYTKLEGWIFYLDFEIKGEMFRATRSVDDQKNIFLNDEKMSLATYREKLEEKLFNIPPGSLFLKFRPLISRFIRQNKQSYASYDIFISKEVRNPIQTLVSNSFLLGLDSKLILDKYKLKKDYDEVDDFKKKIEKDPIIKAYFSEDDSGNIDIKIFDLTEKKESLKKNLEEFKIAEDYNEIRKEADVISAELRALRNKAEKIRTVIREINNSLKSKPDISLNDVRKMYQNANISLGKKVIRKLQEVEEFHEKLLENRFRRLNEEKNKFETDLSQVEENIFLLGKEENKKLQYLNSHGALEEYSSLNKKLSDIDIRLNKLSQYKLLLNEYKDRLEELKQKFSRENLRTNRYLRGSSALIQNNIKIFRSYAERFYKGKSAGISVENNDGLNTLRFDVKVKIQDDAGDAVNEVKIFCFDWTILKGQSNHNVKFLFHDSRITDGVDPRQVRTMLMIADEETRNNDFQYILSLNQNVIDDLRMTMTDEEFTSTVSNNIILTLSDKSNSDKLLGIQVDLDYEK